MPYKTKYKPKNVEKYIGNPNNIICRSLWERRVCRYLDENVNVQKWGSEEIIIPYYSPVDRKNHKYFPDFIVKMKNEDGSFKDEIVPVEINNSRGKSKITKDEQPFTANLDKIPNLKPAFDKNGTVTAANSSSISDGAAALVMMNKEEAAIKNSNPLAKVVAHATHSQDPAWFTTAPIGAIQKVLNKANWDIKDVGLFEINEAFAVVPMAAMKDLNISSEIVNIHGGACALGHPVGTSGARIIATLVSAMHKYNINKGIATLCIGGGEATAVAIEKC